jgi:glycosyltransferase involved in cell wall biosynthesis
MGGGAVRDPAGDDPRLHLADMPLPASDRRARSLAPDARPLTILQLTHQGQGSGSTRSIADLSLELARRGHRVLIGCRPGTLLEQLAQRVGLEVVPLDFARRVPLAGALSSLIAKRGVDVINSHATHDRRALAWLRWRARLPQAFVATRRTMPRTLPFEVLPVALAADRTIAVSSAVARSLTRRLHPGRRLRVVHNGIDLARVDAPLAPDDVSAARTALGDPAGRCVVVVVARRKDQHVLLRSLSNVREPVLLSLVGLEADPTLRDLAARIPERHRVVFVPFTDRALAFYSMASTAALPSRIEGLSQSLMEAMARGLPVLASAAGGNAELVRHGQTGLLVAPLDPVAWARELDRLLTDPALAARLGAAARELVRREFTIERTARLTEAVYREAIARRAGG